MQSDNCRAMVAIVLDIIKETSPGERLRYSHLATNIQTSTLCQINTGLRFATTWKNLDVQLPWSWWESHDLFSPPGASKGLFTLAA